MVREALKEDLNQILELYLFLHKEDKLDDIEHLIDKCKGISTKYNKL